MHEQSLFISHRLYPPSPPKRREKKAKRSFPLMGGGRRWALATIIEQTIRSFSLPLLRRPHFHVTQGEEWKIAATCHKGKGRGRRQSPFRSPDVATIKHTSPPPLFVWREERGERGRSLSGREFTMMGTSTRQILFGRTIVGWIQSLKGIVGKSRKVITHLWVPPLGPPKKCHSFEKRKKEKNDG